MSKKRISLSNILAYALLVIIFLILISVSYVWANGLKFDWRENKLEQTVTIAIENKIKGVNIYLNDKLVAKDAPKKFYRLPEGSYKVVLSKEGCYDWTEYFLLSKGEVGVINQAEMIRKKPTIKELPRRNIASLPVIGYGLEIINGELIDDGKMVTRFAKEIEQVHRYNQGYLYQSGSQLRLYFKKGPNDYFIYNFEDAALAKMELLPNLWKIIIDVGDKLIELDLKGSSESEGDNLRMAD